MAMRPSIKADDRPLCDIIGLIPAEVWVTLIFLVLLKSGELVGLVGSGQAIDRELRAADNVMNVRSYRKG